MTITETGRLTLWLFYKLYNHYKADWSHEMALAATRTTYDQAKEKVREDQDVI